MGRFSQKFNELSRSKIYQEFIQSDEEMKSLVEFSKEADVILKSYYLYQIDAKDLFTRLNEISRQTLSESKSLESLSSYIKHLSGQEYSSEYSNPLTNICLVSLINQ